MIKLNLSLVIVKTKGSPLLSSILKMVEKVAEIVKSTCFSPFYF